MSVCAACGAPLPDDEHLCQDHPSANGERWATGNRIICDFLHRKKLARRLPETERDD